MYWEEDDNRKEFQVNDDVVDLVFSLSCKELPVDHSHALSKALINTFPEFADANSGCAIHSIHLAGSQNGWERPDPSLGQKLILSKRTKLTLRVPAALEKSIQEKLDGLTLNIDGHPLTIGKAKRKLLSKQSTIFARHIVLETGEDEDENKFLMRVISHMKNLDVRVKKALCGTIQHIHTPNGDIATRSIMLDGLRPEQSVRVQQTGIGEHMHLGCGIFIPHKGIEAVKKSEDD